MSKLGISAGVIVVAVVVSCCGCGTIIHGNDQMISISSRPQGAEVVYDGAVRGVTPTNVPISRRPIKTMIILRKEGFPDNELLIKNQVSLWALLGNVVIGGIPGWIIDAATGSFGAYYTDHYDVELDKSGSIARPVDPSGQRSEDPTKGRTR